MAEPRAPFHRGVEFTGFNGRWPTYGTTSEAQFDFPIFNTPGVHAVTNAMAWDVGPIGEHIDPVTLVGSAFTGIDGGFFAYQLFEKQNGVLNLNTPVLMFGGDTFVKPEGETAQVRLFTLYSDPRQGIAIPFAAAATAPSKLASASISPLFLLEGTNTNVANEHNNLNAEDHVPRLQKSGVWVQTSYLVVGKGPGQQSILVLALGTQNEDGQLVGVRRGTSYIALTIDDDDNPATPKVDRGMQLINLTGGIASLGGPEDENGDTPYMMGKTVPHIVIGADSTGWSHNIFTDEPLNPEAFSADGSSTPNPASLQGATYHIGEQSMAQDAPTKTTGDFYGYAAGIYQQTPNGDDPTVGMLTNATPGDVHLKFKDDNQLSAFFNLDTDQGGGTGLTFGDWGNHSTGHSAFISDKIYAATEGNFPSTVTVEQGDGHVQHFADTSLYLVSGNLLNPKAGICSQCDFMRWGTWGGQIQFKDGEWQPVTADVNLGWYVAGDLTSVAEIDNLWAKNATATYNGGVIGNVANNINGQGWKTYVAAGDLTMNWKFRLRKGDLTISNFDGRSYGTGALGLAQVPSNLNQFKGNLTQLSGPSIGLISGGAAGSFVRGPLSPAQGVIGNWNVKGAACGATGIFAGSGVPHIPGH